LTDLEPLYREFSEAPVVSISDSQRKPLPWLNWQGTVYHGLPTDRFRYQPKPGGYLAFLGRISPEKGLDRAIAIARRTNLKLMIAAKVAEADQKYFSTEIEPLLQEAGDLVEFVGEIGDLRGAKSEFLGHARALLFPIAWPEPFGLVMIEAMACGTPTIAFRSGSVPEVITDGVNGYVVDTVDDAVAAAERVDTLSRRTCRAAFEQRFTAPRMARDYLRIYDALLRGWPGIQLASQGREALPDAMPLSRRSDHRRLAAVDDTL
jgi:glycosyltransferase involved in cell wall biosynthesis